VYARSRNFLRHECAVCAYSGETMIYNILYGITTCVSFLITMLVWSVIRLHRMHEIQTIATDVPVAWSVCHTFLPGGNGWTDRGPVWGVDTWGPKKHCIEWGSQSPSEERGDLMQLFPNFCSHFHVWIVLLEGRNGRGLSDELHKLLCLTGICN